MRVGIFTPIVMQIPEVSSTWERDGSVEDLAAIASTADELGFDHLTCAEHVAVPFASAAGRGLTYWDPSATLAFLAGHTRSIKLATSVVVLGYHHPLEIAKRYGTVDLISGGRLVLGVGVGSLQEEFELLGAPFTDRGERADDALRALRAALSDPRPSYTGRFYEFSDVAVQPCAVQAHVPIWVGGRTLRSLRRAITLADGWMPFGLSATDITGMLARVSPPDGFDVVLPTGRALDPSGDPAGTLRRLTSLHDAGATAVTCSITAESSADYRDQLAVLRDITETIRGDTP